MQTAHQVLPATTPTDIDVVRDLFRAYAAEIQVNLCFQNFASEVAALPGDYAPPRGGLFLARINGFPAGCVGLRPFNESVAELKRLYVVPEQRRTGLGRSLVAAALSAAREIGYAAVLLDTLASMQSAIALYESFGFRRVEPYYTNPLPDVLYFQLSLEPRKNH